MILVVDIGNTNITCGLFNGEDLVKKFCMPSDGELSVQDYSDLLKKELNDTNLEGSIIGSVVEELNSRIQYSILGLFGVKAHILSHKSIMPVKLPTESAHLVGADRIANVVRGYNIYKKGVIVVDFGTATTFDIVNSEGEFLGGIIAPGINTQLNSLSQSTSKLPNIAPDEIDTNIGSNTKDAMLAGVIRGTASMVDGMLANIIEEMGEGPVIILTGGFCKLVSKYIKMKYDKIIPNLTLEGLRDLFNENNPIQQV